ncbi:MAG: thioredoxin family protein [Desulfobacteraceae bacterium]
MSRDEVIQIKVGDSLVGIIGLKAVLEDVAKEYENKGDDEEVAEELLRRLSERNYVAPKAEEEYKEAFLREFNRFLGRPVEDAPSGDVQIKVLGPGCTQCDRLEQELVEVMSETGIAADVQHVRDAKEIASYGVMGTPALIINNEVKAVGRVPPKANLIKWLREANPA